MNGLWITFEGTEGCGKSTQLARLADRLRRTGRDVVETREPGGTPIGRELRALLLRDDATPPAAETELLLYAADRAQHLLEVVGPSLARGAIVLCDRYLDATLAYQGHGRGLGVDPILRLHSISPLDRRPLRTLWLDLEPRIGLERARGRDAAAGTATREGRFEAEALAFHERVREGYRALADAEPGRVRRIDAAGSIDEVAARISAALGDLLPESAP